MTDKRIGRNDPCWCGSGQKYKRCHLNREAEPRPRIQTITREVRDASSYAICFHPKASPGACGRIVAAHTVQRMRLLEKIVDAGRHVHRFDPHTRDSDGGLKLERVGWHEASTFKGFCEKHDGPTFAPLEAAPFIASDEQCFLLAYRALCHEIYAKEGVQNALPVLRRRADQGRPVADQMRLQDDYATIGVHGRRGLTFFQRFKSMMDEKLCAADYTNWNHTVIRFQNSLSVVTAGVVSPNRDIEGRILQVLHDPNLLDQQPLLCGLAAPEDGGAVVLSHLPSHDAPARFLESFLARGEARLPSLLVQFFFAHIENTYFSPDWWNGLTEPLRQHVRALAGIPNAYARPVPYAELDLVPWKITAIEHIRR